MKWRKFPDEKPPTHEWLLVAKDDEEDTVFQFAMMYTDGWRLYNNVGPANGDMEWYIEIHEIKYWSTIDYPVEQYIDTKNVD